MKNTKNTLLFLALTLLVSSCYTSRSAFSNDKLSMGMSKEQVISQFGSPFREDLAIQENGHRIEVLYYKEKVYSSDFLFVNTKLSFQDNKLIKKEQTDEKVYQDEYIKIPEK